MKLKGKVALVTGASRGIGRRTRYRVGSREGADIAINYRSHSDEAEDAACAEWETGRRALTLQGDVADRKRDQELVETTVAELGRLDILVARGADTVRKPFVELTESDMADTLSGLLRSGAFSTPASSQRADGRPGSRGKYRGGVLAPRLVSDQELCSLTTPAKAGRNQMTSSRSPMSWQKTGSGRTWSSRAGLTRPANGSTPQKNSSTRGASAPAGSVRTPCMRSPGAWCSWSPRTRVTSRLRTCVSTVVFYFLDPSFSPVGRFGRLFRVRKLRGGELAGGGVKNERRRCDTVFVPGLRPSMSSVSQTTP